jgi:hypothetical protein
MWFTMLTMVGQCGIWWSMVELLILVDCGELWLSLVNQILQGLQTIQQYTH